ncbi:winged helix-turn-helix transcriptional regulator [Halohasta salina]|uniref:winged helix-turn-helix transcriptional regulator n=1 Tax=Halohasta salina TaxID=2961621 RepID=UPI0020A39F7D|nr:winged helix-turn-helix transcriptional regulator [Halohasta salina]
MTRERIREHVTANPGIHFNELTRSLDLAPGQVQYHIRKLKTNDAVVEEPLYGRTHYFTPEYDERERGALAVARRETARDVLVTLLIHGPNTPNAVAEEVDVARSTLEWHLDHLVEQGLVDKRRDERNRITLVLADPESTPGLIRTVEPSLYTQLVTRFSRLFDGMFAVDPRPTDG